MLRAVAAALIAVWLGLLPAPCTAAAGASAAGTVAAFSTYDSVWWLARDGELLESGRRRDFESITRGAAATADGRILEVYTVLPGNLPGGGEERYGGIDVLSTEGALERRWLFAGRDFNGVAADEAGNVWISDISFEELLLIDLEDGSIDRQIPLQTTERLQDIDAAGYFYLLAAGGRGWAIRIRTPEGAYVRDISLGGASVAPWVRVDGEGRLQALVRFGSDFSSRLYTLLPNGQVMGSIEIPVNSTTFALTANGSAWFGFRDLRPPSVARLKEIAPDGTIRQEIALPTGDEAGSGQLGYVEHLAFVPRAARGSLCDEERCAPLKPSPAGYPPGTLAAFTDDQGLHAVLRDGELVQVRGRRAGFDSFSTAGVVATPDGKIVEVWYFAELFGPDRDSGGANPGGIDVRAAEGVEQRWLFERRMFSGIAIDHIGNVWVTSDDALLRIDLADGLIKEQIPLSRTQPESLQDIDGNGYFYLRASLGVGKGWVIRIRAPEGAHVRDLEIEGFSLSNVRIDHEGYLLVAARQSLYTLRPDGQVVRVLEMEAPSSHFVLTPADTIWFGFTASLRESSLDGPMLREIVLPEGSLGEQSIAHVAFVPAAPRGSLCDETICAAATPTLTPTETAGPSPTATETPSPTATPSAMANTPTEPVPTATVPQASATETQGTSPEMSGSSGCDIRSGKGSGWLDLVLLLVVLRAMIRVRRRVTEPTGGYLPSVILAAFLLTSPSVAAGADRYVDCSNGNDINSGALPGQAWRTIQHAADLGGSGDVVHVFNGPCILQQNVSFNRAALSGPGDCTAGDAFCTVFRGDVAVESAVQCDEGCPDGFVISGGVDSIKLEGFTFQTNGERRFGESIKVQGGGNENLVFSNIRVVGDHLNAGVRILNEADGNLPSRNIVLREVMVDGVRQNGFVAKAAEEDDWSATISSVKIIDSVAVNNKPKVGVQRFCSGRCVGGANDGMDCNQPADCPDGLCTPSADGFVTPNAINRTVDVQLQNFVSGNNGDDGVDITDDFENSPASLNYIVDSVIYENCKAGIRTWHSLQIENTHIFDNDAAGIAVVKRPQDTSVASVTIVGNTLVGNARTASAPQIAITRKESVTARIYNTIVAANPAMDRIAFQYDRLGPNFNLNWDYNHFWRDAMGPVVRALVDGTVVVSCNHSQIPTCDQAFTGSHTNSVAQHVTPLFEADGKHLGSSSESWNEGIDPLNLSPGITTLRARDYDQDGHTRPRDGFYDMGAYEGSSLPLPPTRTPTRTFTPTRTASHTPTRTRTRTPTPTPTRTPTLFRPTPSFTVTRTRTPTRTPTITPTPTPCSLYRDEVMSALPAGYWRLGEASGSAALDETGAQNGMYNNVTGLGAAGALPGDDDTALNLPGADDYVSLPGTAPSLQLQESFAIELWVRLNVVAQSNKYLLNKGNRYAVLYGYFANTVEFFVGAGTFTGDDPREESRFTLNDTNWHHIVYSYDHVAGVFYGYKDGVPAFPPVAIPLGIGTTNMNLFFGAAAAGSINNVNAVLDEVTLYNHALQPSEIEAHYAASTCSHLVETISPVADTYVTSLFPSNNYGSATGINVGRFASNKGDTPNRERGLMAFDLTSDLPANANVVQAQLHTYVNGGAAPDGAAVFRNISAFNENLVTWDNQPDVSMTTPAPVLWPAPSGLGWTSVDVTPLVKDCWDNLAGTCSWQMRAVNEVDNELTHDFAFKSKEDPSTADRPFLEVTYVIP